MYRQLALSDAIAYTNHVMTTSFGERFRQHRKAKGFSLFRLSQALGISEGNLCAIEKDRRPASAAVLKRMAEIPEMEISLQQLRAWQILSEATPDELDCLSEEVEKMKQAVRKPNRGNRHLGPSLI